APPLPGLACFAIRHHRELLDSMSVPGPIPAYHEQDAVFGHAFAILHEAILAGAFPAAAVSATHEGKLVSQKEFGRFTFDLHGPEVDRNSIFDLASVSKAIATTSMAMILYDRGALDLDALLVNSVPEFSGQDPRRSQVTIRHLLAHSSGLPAYEKL